MIAISPNTMAKSNSRAVPVSLRAHSTALPVKTSKSATFTAIVYGDMFALVMRLRTEANLPVVSRPLRVRFRIFFEVLAGRMISA